MSRIHWNGLPEDVRRAVLVGLAARPEDVRAVKFPEGGFTSGLVCVIDTAVGSYFIKAMHESSSQASLELIREERLVLSRTKQSYPIPSLMHTVEQSGWIVLVNEAVSGVPLDERTDEAGLIAAMDALVVVRERFVAQEDSLPRVAARYEGLLSYAPQMLHRRPELAGTMSLAEVIARSERAVAAASAGDELVHGDLRPDNVLVEASGRAWLVDWAWGCRGQVWADAVTLMCAARGVRPERRWTLLTEHRVCEHATFEILHGYVDAIAAMYDWTSQQPAPPGVPGLRPWQQEQARLAIDLSLAATRDMESP